MNEVPVLTDSEQRILSYLVAEYIYRGKLLSMADIAAATNVTSEEVRIALLKIMRLGSLR